MTKPLLVPASALLCRRCYRPHACREAPRCAYCGGDLIDRAAADVVFLGKPAGLAPVTSPRLSRGPVRGAEMPDGAWDAITTLATRARVAFLVIVLLATGTTGLLGSAMHVNKLRVSDDGELTRRPEAPAEPAPIIDRATRTRDRRHRTYLALQRIAQGLQAYGKSHGTFPSDLSPDLSELDRAADLRSALASFEGARFSDYQRSFSPDFRAETAVITALPHGGGEAVSYDIRLERPPLQFPAPR